MAGIRRRPSKPHTSSLPNLQDTVPSTPLVSTLPTLEFPADPVQMSFAFPIDPSLSPSLMGSERTLLPANSNGSAHQYATEEPGMHEPGYEPPDGHKVIPVLGGKALINVPARIHRLEEEFIKSICTRKELQVALAACEAKHIKRFVQDLTNIKNATKPIAEIARKHAISPAELADVWRRHNLSMGVLSLVSGLHSVSKDLVVDAQSLMANCPRCDGLKKVPKDPLNFRDGQTRPCPECDGLGKIRREGSSDARKLIFEAVGVTGKKATLIQNANITAHNVENVVGELENLQIGTGSFKQRRRVEIEGEVGDIDAEFESAGDVMLDEEEEEDI